MSFLNLPRTFHHDPFIIPPRRVLAMGYEITITINEDKATAESIMSTCYYLSDVLDAMQIAHTIECKKEGMRLSKVTKPLTI